MMMSNLVKIVTTFKATVCNSYLVVLAGNVAIFL